MGLPIDKLIVATNENDILKRVINTGKYKPERVKPSLSPSMDIQVSSNFERLLFDIVGQNDTKVSSLMNELKIKGEFNLNQKEIQIIQKDFFSEKINDQETLLIIEEFNKKSNFSLDPHTATAVGAARKIRNISDIIILGTAHPFKFLETVEKATGNKIEIPEQFSNLVEKKENFDIIDNNTIEAKKYILGKLNENKRG